MKDAWVRIVNARMTRTGTPEALQVIVLNEDMLDQTYWVPRVAVDSTKPGLVVRKWWADKHSFKYKELHNG